MLALYDQSQPYMYSFNPQNDNIRQWFRESIIGGLSAVYHRHVDLSGSNTSPHAARHVPNGNKTTHCIFVDFNR